MRHRGDWMVPVDDMILEYLEHADFAQPKPLAEEIDYAHKYVNKRLSVLHQYGLVDKVGRGIYTISEIGEDYLNEELDADQLDPES